MSLSSLSSLGQMIKFKQPTSSASSGRDVISNTGLIYYYSFETGDVAGSTLKNNITGGTYDLTLVGSSNISASTVKNGSGSLAVVGTSKYAYLTSFTSGTISNSTQTLCIKFYPTSTTSSFNMPFSSYNGSTASYNCSMQYYDIGSSNFALRIYFYNPSGQELALISTITLNQWYSIVITKNGTTIQGFVNGTNVGQITGTDWKLFSSTASSSFSLGIDRNQPSFIPNMFIDDFRVYNRVLTGTEITTLYTNTL